MRRLFGACVLILTACSPAPQGEQPNAAARPAFEFKKLSLGLPIIEAEKAKVVHECGEPLGNNVTCQLADRKVGDVPIIDSYMFFEAGKFDGMVVDVHTNWFEATAQSLISAYGDPCRVDSRQLQNAFGATFSGDEMVWCFADGELSLRRHAKDDVRESELLFSRFRAEVPAKEFTPDSL